MIIETVKDLVFDSVDILHFDKGDRAVDVLGNDRCDRAARDGIRQIGMPVGIHAADAEKEIARLDFAGVRFQAADLRIFREHGLGKEFTEFHISLQSTTIRVLPPAPSSRRNAS